MLLLFVLYAYGQVCDSCDTCQTLPKVHVEKLCADELCVGGHIVPPGDGNPCTVQDVVDGETVSVHIKDCCETLEDCVPFRPSACYLSTCETIVGDARGWCKHTPIVDCCVDDSDCPKRPCHTSSCGGDCDDSVLFFTANADSPHHTPWLKRNINFATECTKCEYEEVTDCCVTSAECDTVNGGPCPGDSIGVCAVNNQCVCIPIQQVECTHANEEADCAYLAPKLAQCENECAAIRCVSGYCVIEADPAADNDGDDYDCTTDCDDTDPRVHADVWCAPSDQDSDGDGFLICGTQVTRRCGACLEGQVPVEAADVSQGCIDADVCTLEFNCDCCDAANGERPDHTICCQANCQVEDPDVPDCGGDPRSICVTKPAETQTMTEECQAWGTSVTPKLCTCGDTTSNCDCDGEAGRCDECWEAVEGTCPEFCSKKRQAATCDSCPDSPATTADKQCMYDCDLDGMPICSPDAGSLIECCTELASHGGDYDRVTPPVISCCEAVLAHQDDETAIDDPLTDVRTAAFCNLTSTPYLADQCDCPTGYVDVASFDDDTHQDYCDCTADVEDSFSLFCGVDADNDCVPACVNERICVSTFTLGGIDDELCIAEGYRASADPNACDCADDNPLFAAEHGCFPDIDGDSFLNCTECTTTCGACEPGFVPIENEVKKRSPKVREPLKKRQVCVAPPTYLQCGDTVDAGRCDCCDMDAYAYPGSRWCSSSPRLCPDATTGEPSYDYNCDDEDDHLVVCEDHVEHMDEDGSDDIMHNVDNERYMRGCQPVGSSENSPGVFEEYLAPGECALNSTSDGCTTTAGFCLERKRSTGDILSGRGLTKRAMGDGNAVIPAPIECNGMGLVDPDEGDGPAFGDCFEYLEDCHFRTRLSVPTCHCDCDICVLVGQ